MACFTNNPPLGLKTTIKKKKKKAVLRYAGISQRFVGGRRGPIPGAQPQRDLRAAAPEIGVYSASDPGVDRESPRRPSIK